MSKLSTYAGGSGLLGRWIIMTILVSQLLLAVAGCGGEQEEPDLSLERVTKSGKLVIGVDPSYPPFESCDDKGQLTGIDVDLAKGLASRLGVEPSFVAIDMGGIIDALVARKIDVIISSLAPAPEYSKHLAYSQPYFNAGQVIVAPKGTAGTISLEGLKGKMVTVESGSAGELEMLKHTKKLEGMRLRPVMTAEQAMLEVKQGRADAAVVDAISALLFTQQEGALAIAGEPITDEPFVIAVRRQDRALLKEIDRILGELQSEGYLEQLQERL